MNTSTSNPPLGSWLSKLSVVVSSSSNRVYPNGRQQIEVSVVVEPLMSQTVKPDELASVRLMVRNTLGQFAPLPEVERPPSPWFFSKVRNDFLEYPGTSARKAAVDSTAVYTRMFYVMAGKSGGTGQRVETLYVGITRHTEEGQYDYLTDGSESGFNSNVEVRTAEVPVFQVPGNYVFDRMLTAGNGDSDVFIWQYSLAGANVQQPLVGFVSASMEPAGMIQWDDRNAGVTRASHVGFSAPSTTAVRYNTSIQLGSAFRPLGAVTHPKKNHVTLVLQGGNNIPYHSQSAINHNGPCFLSAVDVYGNEHELRISFKDASPHGRHELVLS